MPLRMNDSQPNRERALQGAPSREFYRPRKVLLTLRVDADVLAYFRGTGEGYQAQMNRFLTVAMREGQMRQSSGLPECLPFQGSSAPLKDTVALHERKLQVSLRLDAETVAWYKARGKGYQSIINRNLRLAMLELRESSDRD